MRLDNVTRAAPLTEAHCTAAHASLPFSFKLPDMTSDLQTKAAAWDTLEKELNELMPEWNDPSEGVRSAGDAARVALRRLYNAAEWGDISTTKMHIKNELAVLRGMLELKDLPPRLETGLRAHLQRLARLV